MELVAGESYLIVGAAKEGNGHDYIRVRSVRLKNCTSLFIHDSTMLYVHMYVNHVLLQALALLPNSTYTKNESGWVIQDEPGWPSGYFMRPLPGFMLQTVEETPQVCIRTSFCICTIYYILYVLRMYVLYIT